MSVFLIFLIVLVRVMMIVYWDIISLLFLIILSLEARLKMFVIMGFVPLVDEIGFMRE
jgi:hypothetical protein